MNFGQKIAVVVSMMLFAAALLFAWSRRDHYEFHSGLNGTVLWRCNKQSGLVEYCTFGGGWQTVGAQVSGTPAPGGAKLDLQPVPDGDKADIFLDGTNKPRQ